MMNNTREDLSVSGSDASTAAGQNALRTLLATADKGTDSRTVSTRGSLHRPPRPHTYGNDDETSNSFLVTGQDTVPTRFPTAQQSKKASPHTEEQGGEHGGEEHNDLDDMDGLVSLSDQSDVTSAAGGAALRKLLATSKPPSRAAAKSKSRSTTSTKTNTMAPPPPRKPPQQRRKQQQQEQQRQTKPKRKRNSQGSTGRTKKDDVNERPHESKRQRQSVKQQKAPMVATADVEDDCHSVASSVQVGQAALATFLSAAQNGGDGNEMNDTPKVKRKTPPRRAKATASASKGTTRTVVRTRQQKRRLEKANGDNTSKTPKAGNKDTDDDDEDNEKDNDDDNASAATSCAGQNALKSLLSLAKQT